MVYDCDNILSIDSFIKSLRGVKLALGNLAMIASRAVLRAMSNPTPTHREDSLFRHRHQILRAQISP